MSPVNATNVSFLLLLLGLSLGYIMFKTAGLNPAATRDTVTLDRLTKLLESRIDHLTPGQGVDVLGSQKASPEDTPVMRVASPTWTPPKLPSHLAGADQADPELIAEIRQNWILSPDRLPLNLSHPTKTFFSQAGQDKWLDRFFHNKTGGFYIECGAFDGEEISNTLYFERERSWRGLLIEANPTNFQKVLTKHRNAFTLNACLSPTTKAATLNYTSILSHPYLSRFESNFQARKEAIVDKVGNFTAETHTIQCFPLYSILKALGNPEVDFFSIDIEGAEKYVLRTLPLDQTSIEVFIIETGEMGPGRDKKVNYYEVLMEGYRPRDIDGDTFDVAMYKEHAH